MSRVDEAMRRAAALREGIDDRAANIRTATDESILEQYPAEKLAKAPEPQHARIAQIGARVSRREASRQRPATPPARDNKLVSGSAVPHFVLEQYRRLAAILHELQLQRGVKTLMVSSAAPREGKTLTITNLALTLSDSYHQRVLLIDADLRRPAVHETLGIPNGVGLAGVLRSGALELPCVELSPHLCVLTAGRADMSLLAQLSSESLRAAVAHASTQFDWVLLDTPPIGLLPDAQLVARICEAILFVIGSGVASYDFVQRSIAALGSERIVGTVLNRVERTNGSMGDYYDYEGYTSVG